MTMKIDISKADIKELYCYEIALLNVVVNLQNEIVEIRAKRKDIEEQPPKSPGITGAQSKDVLKVTEVKVV